MPAKPTMTDVFHDEHSQAVKIPDAFRLDCSQVTLSSDGHTLTLTPVPTSWVNFFATEDAAPAEFMDFNQHA